MTRPNGDGGRLSLAQHGLRGAAWSYAGAAVVIVGQLGYTAMTARLISPAEFGAYATAQALLGLVGYLTLSTVGNAIIRHPSLDRTVIGTGLVITGIAGSAVAALVIATADLWAEVWRSPGAVPLLRLFAPQVVLGALAIVPLSLIRRDLRFRTASLIETTSIMGGFAIGAVLAWQSRSAEALVAGQVASAGALLVLSAAAARSQLALTYSGKHIRSLFSFSAQVSLQNLGHYLNNTLPSFVVSRSLGQASLGFFSRGSLLVVLPLAFLAQGVQKTLYPIFPSFRGREQDCRRMMLDVASVTSTFVWPLFAALAGFAPLVVKLLLGAEWAVVSTLIGPLCLYAMANFSYAIFTSFAESFGALRQIWLVQVGWTVALAGSLALAVAWNADMTTIAFVAAIVQIGVHIVQVVVVGRLQLVDTVGTFRAEASAALVALVWYAATMLTTQLLGTGSDLALRVVASAAVTALLMLGTWSVLPYLPAGKAFARRGIRVTWRSGVSRVGDN